MLYSRLTPRSGRGHRMQSFLTAILEDRLLELSSTDKTEALQVLARRVGEPQDHEARDKIVRQVLERESQANTYLGYGIACPHARLAGEGTLRCAIGWSREGIDYGQDGTPRVHLVLMYLIPFNVATEYMAEISLLARVLQRDERMRDLGRMDNLQEVNARLLAWADVMAKTLAKQDQRAQSAYRHDSTVVTRLLLPEILDMVRPGYLNGLRAFIIGLAAPEIADLIAAVRDERRIVLFRLLPRALADEVFSLLDAPEQNQLLEAMAQEESRAVISALPPDDRTALFEELPANVTQRLLRLLDDKDRREALALLSYPTDSVGRLMTNRYVSVRPDWTVGQAMEHVRGVGMDTETLAMLYVTDEKGLLLDDLRLRRLILADPKTPVRELMDGSYAYLHSLQDREEAVQAFRKYDLYALPVIDANGILLGIVTSDDILDVADEEATEDIHKSSAIHPLGMEYLKAPLRRLYSRRIPWLLVLIFVNILSGAGIAHFESLIDTFVVLVFFMPLLIGSGGNAGAQAATLVIRGMALGELKLSDFVKAAGREALVAALLGLSMGIAVFMLGWWRGGMLIGLVTALSMLSIVLLGSLIGLTLPFVLRKVGQDPAAASGPLVTSLADILGIILYFSIASFVLT